MGALAVHVWRLAGLLRAAACWLVLCVPLLLCSALSVLSLGHAAPVEAQAGSALPVPGLTRAPKNDAAPLGLAVRPAQRRQQPPHTTANGEALQQRLQLCVTGELPVRVVVVAASALDTVALAMVRIRVALFERRVADMGGLHLRLSTRAGRVMPPHETLSSLGLSPNRMHDVCLSIVVTGRADGPHGLLGGMQRSRRANAGANMPDLFALPRTLQRPVLSWLAFRGFVFKDPKIARPPNAPVPPEHSRALLLRVLEGLEDDADAYIRDVATQLRDFVLLQHAQRGDLSTAQLAERLHLPEVDVINWLQERNSDPFARFEAAGTVSERLQLFELLHNNIGHRIAAELHYLCALCGRQLDRREVRWRPLRLEECNYLPAPPTQPAAAACEYDVRYAGRANTTTHQRSLSVCGVCTKPGVKKDNLPLLNNTVVRGYSVWRLDPVPASVLAVPVRLRGNLTPTATWFRVVPRDKGTGFAGFQTVRGFVSPASESLQHQRHTDLLSIMDGAVESLSLYANRPEKRRSIVAQLQQALQDLIAGGNKLLRHFFATFEKGVDGLESSVADLALRARGKLASRIGTDASERPAQIIVPDDAMLPVLGGAADDDNGPMLGYMMARPLGADRQPVLSSVENVDSALRMPSSFEENPRLDRVALHDKYRNEKLFPYLFTCSRGGWRRHYYCISKGDRNGKGGMTLMQYMTWALLQEDGRFRAQPEFLFSMVDYYQTLQIVGANNCTGVYHGDAARVPPTVGDVAGTKDFWSTFSFLPHNLVGSSPYWAAKRANLFAIRADLGREADYLITLTFNSKWPEVQELVQRNGGGLYWHYPVECQRILEARMRKILPYIIGSKSVLRSRVVGHWGRAEENGRLGGNHFHLLVWVEHTANVPLGSMVSARMPGEMHPLRSAILRFFVHKHVRDYCAGPLRCRFGYSQQHSDVNIFYRDDLPQGRVAGKHVSKFRPVYARGPGDENVVPHIPDLVALWDGQCNVEVILQPGTAADAAARLAGAAPAPTGDDVLDAPALDYASKNPVYSYVTKGEETVSVSGLNATQKHVKYRVMSTPSAARIALGLPLVYASAQSMYLTTALASQRRRQVLPKKLQPTDPDAQVRFALGLPEKYLLRPHALRFVPYPVLYAWWDVKWVRGKAHAPATGSATTTAAAAAAGNDDDDDDNNNNDVHEVRYDEAAERVDDDDDNDDDDDDAAAADGRGDDAVAADGADAHSTDGAAVYAAWLQVLGGDDAYRALAVDGSVWFSRAGWQWDGDVTCNTLFPRAGTMFVANGLRFVRRSARALITWTYRHPSAGEPFFFHFALLTVPFADDPTTIMREATARTSITPFQDYCTLQFPALFAGSPSGRMRALLQIARVEANRSGASARDVERAAFGQLQPRISTLVLGVRSGGAAAGCARAIGYLDELLVGASDPATITVGTQLRTLLVWRHSAAPMNVEQLRVHDAIVADVLAAKRAEPVRRASLQCVLGSGGTGKSHVIRHVVFTLRVLHGLRVAITATTGNAAVPLNGTTVHSWAGLSITLDVTQLQKGTAAWQRVADTDVLIVDEISMMDSRLFDAMEAVLRRVRGNEDAMGRTSVLMFGDFLQLPPVPPQEELEWDAESFAHRASAPAATAPAVGAAAAEPMAPSAAADEEDSENVAFGDHAACSDTDGEDDDWNPATDPSHAAPPAAAAQARPATAAAATTSAAPSSVAHNSSILVCHSLFVDRFIFYRLTINERAARDPLFAALLSHVQTAQLDRFDLQLLQSRVCATLVDQTHPYFPPDSALAQPAQITANPTDPRNLFFAARADGPLLRTEQGRRLLCAHGDFANCVPFARGGSVVVGRRVVRDRVNMFALVHIQSMPGEEPGVHLDWSSAPEHTFEALDFSTLGTNAGREPLRDGERRATLNKLSQYPQSLSLKPGAVCILLRNLNVEKKQANGSRLVYRGYLGDLQADPGHVQLEFRMLDTNDIIIVQREHDVRHQHHLARWMFPILPAFAVSVHKGQGQSMARVFTSLGMRGDPKHCDHDCIFVEHQAYVALSRCTTLQGLHMAAFDVTAIRAHPDVQRFYTQHFGNAPAMRRPYYHTGIASVVLSSDNLSKIAFSTSRYLLDNTSVPVVDDERVAPTVPSSPVSSDDESERPGANFNHRERERARCVAELRAIAATSHARAPPTATRTRVYRALQRAHGRAAASSDDDDNDDDDNNAATANAAAVAATTAASAQCINFVDVDDDGDVVMAVAHANNVPTLATTRVASRSEPPAKRLAVALPAEVAQLQPVAVVHREERLELHPEPWERVHLLIFSVVPSQVRAESEPFQSIGSSWVDAHSFLLRHELPPIASVFDSNFAALYAIGATYRQASVAGLRFLVLPSFVQQISHFVLLVADLQRRVLCLYDSIWGCMSSLDFANTLLAELRRSVPATGGGVGDWTLLQGHCATQPNGTDCGVHCMINTRIVVDILREGQHAIINDDRTASLNLQNDRRSAMSLTRVATMRKHLAQCVLDRVSHDLHNVY